MQSTSFTHRVHDYLDRAPAQVSPEMPLRVVQRMLVEAQLQALPVVENGIVVGIISSLDLMRIASDEDDMTTISLPWPEPEEALGELTAEDAMDCEPPCISSGASLVEAARMMYERRIDRLLVVDSGRLQGVITSHDVLHVFTPRRFREPSPHLSRPALEIT
jgi:CBS domain-containing protein